MAEKPTAVELEHGPELTREQFAAYAEDILGTFAGQGPAKHWGRRQMHRELTEAYVNQAEHPRLARFADLLITADTACRVQERMTDMKEAGKHHSELFERYKEAAINYNHLLRDVVTEQPRMFTREQLSGWMERASQDDRWTNGLLRGVIAEVATAQQLTHIKGVESVRYSTAAEEPKGIDVVAMLNSGKACNIDVKCGESQTIVEVEPTTAGVKLQVEDHFLAGFGIAPFARAEFDARLARAVRYIDTHR